jgi:hypothetical protein
MDTPMKPIKYLHSKKYLNIALALICIVLFAISLRPSRATSSRIRRIPNLQITNSTRAFNLINYNFIEGDEINLTFRNDYDKRISGFNVAIGSGRIQTELIISGDDRYFIAPGAIFEKTYVIQNDLQKYGITIGAVIFDDGSSDGNPKFIKEMKDYRLGMKKERERVLLLLDQISNLPDTNILKALEDFEADIQSSLPDSKHNGKLDNVDLGIRNERYRMIQEVRLLRDGLGAAPSDNDKITQLRNKTAHLKETSKRITQLASH